MSVLFCLSVWVFLRLTKVASPRAIVISVLLREVSAETEHAAAKQLLSQDFARMVLVKMTLKP